MNIRNQVQLMGNVGKDIELKSTTNGNYFANFSVATNEYYKNSKGEKVQDTQWHNVTIWGKQAELASKILQKGTSIVLQGKLVHRQYETAEGNKRYITEVKVSEFEKLTREPKEDNDSTPF